MQAPKRQRIIVYPAPTVLQQVASILFNQPFSIDIWPLLLTCRELYAMFPHLHHTFQIFTLNSKLSLGYCSVSLEWYAIRRDCYRNARHSSNAIVSAIAYSQIELLNLFLEREPVREAITADERLPLHVLASGDFGLECYFGVHSMDVEKYILQPRHTFKVGSPEILRFHEPTLAKLSVQSFTEALVWTLRRRPHERLFRFIAEHIETHGRVLDLGAKLCFHSCVPPWFNKFIHEVFSRSPETIWRPAYYHHVLATPRSAKI